MKILTEKRCNIGEGPIWNEKEQKLYYTNGYGGNEICTYDFKSDTVKVRPLPLGAAAFAFDKTNRLIISHAGGVHILNDDNSLSPIYDNEKYKIQYANDMKVGPDGAIYVGTQSGKRKGVSDKVDGKLYRIAPDGEVTVLLDEIILSNGMDWSTDERRFYHTDSDTGIIKEYYFDKESGAIEWTGRQVSVPGVDGFTIGLDRCLYVGCWGLGHVAIVDTDTLEIKGYIETPAQIPTSCGFCGENMNILATTTAYSFSDTEKDKNAGFTLLKEMDIKGRKPYLFGETDETL